MTAPTTSPERERLTDPAVYENPSRDCDVVMKGGITSGVVYPLATCELATEFRLRNVGGTSAGAIAAAAAAAAEHGRQAGVTAVGPAGDVGFAGLARMQTWLSKDHHLFRLFQPNPSTKSLYGLLAAIVTKANGLGAVIAKWLRVLVGLLRVALFGRTVLLVLLGLAPAAVLFGALSPNPGSDWALGAALLAAATALVVAAVLLVRSIRLGLVALLVGGGLMVWVSAASDIGWGVWAIAAAWLVGLVGLAAGLATAVGWRAVRILPENHFGLMTGSLPDGHAGPEPLSDWLTKRLNRLAGLDEADDPITFGQLWAGPHRPTPTDPDETEKELPDDKREEKEEERQKAWEAIEHTPNVNLEMLTTCLTEGRPYRMPRDFRTDFFFKPEELRRYVPAAVVDYMTQNPAPANGKARALQERAKKHGLLPLPLARHLPVVIATRMSLSFPGLISAVPLYSVDNSYPVDIDGKPTDRDHAIPEVVWFSDGGITSNFPVSFFDELLPRWPTFGINLRPFHRSRTKEAKGTNEACKIYLPPRNERGIHAWRTPFPDDGLNAITGFAHSILDTMQNWADNSQLLVPGFRDRVVHISHTDKEGGMNLDMPDPTLYALSERGRLSGARLTRFYTQEPTGGEPVECPSDLALGPRTVGWRNHRWVRLRSTLRVLQRALDGLRASYIGEGGYEPYRSDIQRYFTEGEKEAAVNPNRTAAPGYDWKNVGQRDHAIALMQGGPDTTWNPPPDTPIDEGIIGLANALRTALDAAPGETLHRGAPNPEPELRLTPGPRRPE